MENDQGVENDQDVGVEDDCTFLACPTKEIEKLFTKREQTLEKGIDVSSALGRV